MKRDELKLKAVKREQLRTKKKYAPRGGTLSAQVLRTHVNREYLGEGKKKVR